MNWLPESISRKGTASCVTAGSRIASEVSGKISANGCLRLELSAETLQHLLASGQLCAKDIRCLDCESKDCLWKLLLKSCAMMINSGKGCNGDYT